MPNVALRTFNYTIAYTNTTYDSLLPTYIHEIPKYININTLHIKTMVQKMLKG